MKPLLILRHIECEGLGYLTELLTRHGLDATLIAIDQGMPVPSDPNAYSGIIALGGSMSVNDPLPWIAQEIQLLRTAHAREMPVLGICLGAQMLSKALGGRVTRNAVKEIGWLPVHRANSQHSDWLQGIPQQFDAFHWHGETFSIPEQASLLISSAHCPHQAFALGNSLALQFHLEITETMIGAWATQNEDEILSPSLTVQSAVVMMQHARTHVPPLHKVADMLFGTWVKRIKLKN